MSVTFEKATRVAAPIIIGLYGKTGTGKTYSALRLARALGKRIVFGNSEGKRGRRYADEFDYSIFEITEPYASAKYTDVIVSGQGAGDVVIMDSMSHEHEGAGGMLNFHEQELQRMGWQQQK